MSLLRHGYDGRIYVYKSAAAAAAVTGFGLPSAAWGCVAQAGGSLCMGVELVVGFSDTHLNCIWSAGRSRGAVVGDAWLRAMVLPRGGCGVNEYIVVG